MKLLNLGPQFTMKRKHNRHKCNYHRNRKSHQTYRNKWQNTYCYLAPKRMKQVEPNNKQNLLQKWQ